MNKDHEALVRNGAEMGLRLLMVELLGAAEKDPNKSLNFVEMQYLFQSVLERVKKLDLASHN